jgi:KaiC/GvpD/RAD55 family RecA-like ATPase
MDRQVIASLDPFIDALAPGRVHILTGATGTGKSTAALRFIDAGLRRGESAILVTSLRPRDLRALAEHLGIRLEMALAEERLVIMRHANDLTARLGRAGALYGAIDELRLAVPRAAPGRLVIDSIAPFLADDGASAGAVGRLAAWLDGLGATSILTLPGSLDQDYDRRLEPLVQEAAGIFHLSRDQAGGIALDAVTVRAKSLAPFPSRIRLAPGRDVAALPQEGAARPTRARQEAPSEPGSPGRRLVLIHAAAAADAELLELLRRAYEVDSVAIRRYPAARVQSLAAVMIETTYQTMDASLRAIERLAASGGETPIVAVSPFDLRSVDRARVLHAGADEFLTRAMGPAEFLQRLGHAIRRRRIGGEAGVALDIPLARHPVTDGGPLQPLDGRSFDEALTRYDAAAPGVPRTVVHLKPRNGDVRDIAALAMRTMRITGGDLAAISDGGVLVYLHGTRRRDAVFFTDRVRAQWAKQGQGALSIDARVHEPARPRRESAAEHEPATVAEG